MLRMVVGVTAAVQGQASLANADDPTIVTLAAGVLAIVSGASLLIGFFTPGAAALAGLCLVRMAIASFPDPAAALFLDRVGALLVAAVAAAVVLLGPGALSLDARLFGRRELVFPHDSHHPRS